MEIVERYVVSEKRRVEVCKQRIESSRVSQCKCTFELMRGSSCANVYACICVYSSERDVSGLKKIRRKYK